MDIFAFYFPQFYAIKENSRWWGEGFTDWDLVKAAQAISPLQLQPRRPLGNSYYDQSSAETIEAQIRQAIDYGLAGFNFYHYWFDGRLMLEKPIEHFRASKQKQLQYCITWANESWTRQWIGSAEVLMAQSSSYDKNIWQAHFDYLRPHFEDARYLRIEDRPVFCIYRPEILPMLQSYLEFFNEQAAVAGLKGIHWVAIKSYEQANAQALLPLFNSQLSFQPRNYFNQSSTDSTALSALERQLRALPETLQRPISWLKYRLQKQKAYCYDDFSRHLLEYAQAAPSNEWQSLIVDWDNTPRYGKRSKFFYGSSPEKFHRLLTDLAAIVESKDSAQPLLFVNAWNEWSEGAYLEPDEQNADAYLQAIKHFKQATCQSL